MSNNLTEIVFILDRSGSMASLVTDTIGGYNSMIEQQKKENGEATITTVIFDDRYEMLHDNVNIKQVKNMTDSEYYARGMTALYDAVGKTINSVGHRLSQTKEDKRPSKVIFVITTDGFENASKEFSKSKIKEMIETQQGKYSWTFMFLGANMDAMSEAASIGINPNFARTYTANEVGTQSVYSSLSKGMTVLRGSDVVLSKGQAGNLKTVLDEIE